MFLGDCKKIILEETGMDRNINLRRESRRSTEIYYFEVAGHSKKDLLSLYSYLYSDSVIFLDRKKEKFIEILSKI